MPIFVLDMQPHANDPTDDDPGAGAWSGRGPGPCDPPPPRTEAFLRPPGVRSVDSEPDTRVPNCTIFHFHKEDHTLGNLLKYQLHKNRAVLFAGYKVPHPLFAEFDLRVQTDGSITPKAALEQACREIIADLHTVSREFTKEYELFKVRNLGSTGVNNAGPASGAPGV